MDIKIKNEATNEIFNYCVRGILQQDEKFLIMQVNNAGYYHIPGGHVEIGETGDQALIREIKEEIGIDVIPQKLICVSEQFYKKKETNIHNIIFYFIIKPKRKIITENKTLIENDKGKTIKNELRWISIKELENTDLKPPMIKNAIINNAFNSFWRDIDIRL